MKPTNMCILLLAVFGQLLSLSVAQAQAQVTLSLSEFEELFSSAQLKDGERRLQDQSKRQEREHQRKLKQLEGQNNNKDIFPENFQVLKHTAAGSYNASNDFAVFDMQLTVRIMGSQWTMVPLVTNSTVATDWNIQVWKQDEDDFISFDPITSADVLLLRKDQPMLATNRSGLFQIQWKAYNRVSQTRNIRQLSMSQFLYPISDLHLRVAGAVREFSVEPVSAVLDVKTADNSTQVQATLPLMADRIEIRWLDVADAMESQTMEPSSKDNRPLKGSNRTKVQEDVPQATAAHEVVHSIGEGIVRSSHILELTSTSQQLSSAPFYLAVRGYGLRITSIEGHALQSWEIVDGTSTENEKVVRVIWKSSHLDSSATLILHTESERSEEEQVELPRIECRGVLRQVGHVGVVKDANVEVHEHSIRGGLTRCDPTDLSSQLRLNLDRPIVLSYKYLNPKNASVLLDVQEHVAMETLEATVDRLHYKAVVTETHTMHSLVLVLQSTKLQYLELFGLPEKASMFSLLVNSVPAKPVEGKDGSILVPLLIGLDPEAANEGNNLLTSVEVSYISPHNEPMGENGSLSLDPPHVKLPVSVLTTHVRLPKQYEYVFSGDFSEPSRDLAFPVPSTYSYQTGKRVVETDYSFSFKDDVWPDENTRPKESVVKIVTPNTGRSFYFHRLLVLDTKLHLNANYTTPVPVNVPWWSRIFGRQGS